MYFHIVNLIVVIGILCAIIYLFWVYYDVRSSLQDKLEEQTPLAVQNVFTDITSSSSTSASTMQTTSTTSTTPSQKTRIGIPYSTNDPVLASLFTSYMNIIILMQKETCRSSLDTLGTKIQQLVTYVRLNNIDWDTLVENINSIIKTEPADLKTDINLLLGKMKTLIVENDIINADKLRDTLRNITYAFCPTSGVRDYFSTSQNNEVVGYEFTTNTVAYQEIFMICQRIIRKIIKQLCQLNATTITYSIDDCNELKREFDERMEIYKTALQRENPFFEDVEFDRYRSEMWQTIQNGVCNTNNIGTLHKNIKDAICNASV